MTGDGGKAGDSFLTYRKVMPNLEYIKERGIDKFIAQQEKRIASLQAMLRDFDDVRSKSYYCIAATLLSVSELKTSIARAEQELERSNSPGDASARAKILREIIDAYADKAGIELKLRKESRKLP